jgi:hypothetical protein
MSADRRDAAAWERGEHVKRRKGLLLSAACTIVAAAAVVTSGLTGMLPASAATAPRPVVSKLSVTSGPVAGGTRVEIAGQNFTQVSRVIFGSTAGTQLKLVSGTLLFVTAPKHAAGTVNIEVVTTHGTSAAVTADRFSYVSPPSVTKLVNSSGSQEGGTRVEIAGSNFLGVSKVEFGSTAGTQLKIASSTLLFVTAPPGALGPVDIRVVGAYGTSATSAADHFTYVQPAEALSWGPANPADGHGGFNAGLLGCRSATLCFAFDKQGNEIQWNGGTWVPPVNAVTPGYTEWFGPFDGGGTSCASATFCVMVNRDAFVYSGGRWTQTALAGGLPQNVSCAPSTPGGSPFCMVATQSGNVLTYDGTAWSAPVKVDTGVTPSGSEDDVSCASASFCVLADSAGGIMTWDGMSWAQTVAALPGVSGPPLVSCVSTAWCLAVDAKGDVYTFNGSSWAAAGTDGGTGAPDRLACTSTTFCMVADDGGEFAHYDGSGWSVASDVLSPGNSGNYVPDVACSGQTCIATLGGNITLGSVFTGGQWSSQVQIDAAAELNSVSCPTATFCAAVGDGEDAVTETNGTWSSPVHLTGALDPHSVSCTSATFCLAADNNGSVWRYDGSNWTSAPSPVAPHSSSWQGVVSVACTSPTFCVAAASSSTAGGGGLALFDGSTWTAPQSVGGDSSFSTVGCSSPTFCVAVDSPDHGPDNTAFFNGTSWTLQTGVLPNAYGPLTCGLSANFCAVNDEYGPVNYLGYVDFFDGKAWTSSSVDSIQNDPVVAVSCTSATFCAAADANGNTHTFDGKYWSAAYNLNATINGLTPTDSWTALSCGSPKSCVIVSQSGDARVGTSS